MSEINIDEIRVPPEQIAAWQVEQAAKAETPSSKTKESKRFELKFYKFPPVVIEALCKAQYWPAWNVAAAIYKQWYDTFQGNPVKLTSWNLRENYDVSKDQKWRALKILEGTRHYIVERIPGKNPLVTMTWLPRKAPNQY
jgi:hypothetical protein